jgi:hypothetical protein
LSIKEMNFVAQGGRTANKSANPAKTTPGEPNESFRIWFRSWRYFFWLLGLVIVVGLFYAEENWRGRRAWETYQRQLEARGELLAARAFIPESVPRSENFASTPLLAPLFDFIPGTQRWGTTNVIEKIRSFAPGYDAAARAIKASREPRFNSWITARIDLASWHAAFLAPTNRTGRGESGLVTTNFTVREAAEGVLRGLAECEPVFDELRTASKRRYSRFDIRYEQEDPASILLPHLSVLKQFCTILQLRASAELALGRTEDAASEIELMLCLADACRQEPILISQLVRMAQLQLALQPLAEGIGQWSEPQLRAFQERLLRFDFCADMKRSFDAERVFFGGGMIDFFHRHPNQYGAIVGDSSNLPGLVWAVAPSGWFDFEKLNYGHFYEFYRMPGIDLPNHRVSPSAASQAAGKIRQEVSKPWPTLLLRHRVFSSLLLPALSSPLTKTAFGQTAVDTAAIACALERYRLAHGQFPDSLEELEMTTPTANPQATNILKKVPRDIINGQPLKYRRTPEDSYVLYSVGWNEKDDGAIVGAKKPGEAEGSVEGDWVWRPLPDRL